MTIELQSWEHFPHAADIGIRGYGSDQAKAYEQAALALTAVITDPADITPASVVDIRCEAPDKELLLVDWLNALIYEMATRHMLFSHFEVRLKDGQLDGRAWGEPVDIHRHHPRVEIKGATYTELHVNRTEQGWLAQCVVDV